MSDTGAERQARHRALHGDWKPTTKAQKAAYAAYQRQWRKANPEKVRAAHLKHCYGLTQADVDAMLASQDGKCRICPTDIRDRPYIDHCHKTMRVRGLLCLRCNSHLGWLEKHEAEVSAYLSEGTQ
jgi:hypothetical protein